MLVHITISTVDADIAGSIDVQKSNRTRICSGDVNGWLYRSLDRGSGHSSVISRLLSHTKNNQKVDDYGEASRRSRKDPECAINRRAHVGLRRLG